MGSNTPYSSMSDDALQDRSKELYQSLESNKNEIDTHQENVTHGDSADRASTIMILNSLRMARDCIRSEIDELESEQRSREQNHTCIV